MDYLVSAHGGRYHKTKKITVPDGISIVFFVYDGEALTNKWSEDSNAWALYNHLKPGLALEGNTEFIKARVVEHVQAKGEVYDYSCWGMADLGLSKYSELAEVGGSQIMEIGKELALSEVIDVVTSKNQGPSTIFWLACRTVG